jgi:predicted nucleic acid-binding protein
MTQVFADTSFWFALLNPRDVLHSKAMALSTSLTRARLVTSEMVLVELLNALSDAGPLRTAAAAAAQAVRENANTTLIKQSEEQFEEAFTLYRKSADKNWSLTDCSSFLIMQDLHIPDALTHDRHFQQAGFTALLR